jgi:hypothetical protein
MKKKKLRPKYGSKWFEMDNQTYTKIMKNDGLYCYICVRRAGSYLASCHPSDSGNAGWRKRKYRNWKNQRRFQYKN